MPDKFDEYREALVIETNTVWPDEYDELEPEEKDRLAARMHEDPASCGQLEYVRMHTGFCRQITVTPEDIERIGGLSS